MKQTTSTASNSQNFAVDTKLNHIFDAIDSDPATRAKIDAKLHAAEASGDPIPLSQAFAILKAQRAKRHGG